MHRDLPKIPKKEGPCNANTTSPGTILKPIINLIKRLSVYKMCPPKQGKSVIQLLAAVGITLMTATASFAEGMFPSNLWNKRGSSTSQSLEVLHVKDQHGSDDNFDKYMEFNSDQDGYVGDFRFNLHSHA